MTAYVARLLARAMPPEPLEAPSAAAVRPPDAANTLEEGDPFETTVYDAAEWPASVRTAPPQRPAVPALDAAPPGDDRRREPQTIRPAPIALPQPLPAPFVPEPLPHTAAVEDDPAAIAPTLRPPPEVAMARTADLTPRREPDPQPARIPDDALARADRFMEQVVASALRPPEVRVETTREVLREHKEVTVVPPPLQPPLLEPAAMSDPPAAEPPTPGLVIGSLRINVVPPAPAPIPASQPAASPARVVVVTQGGSASPGVPSFSRFG